MMKKIAIVLGLVLALALPAMGAEVDTLYDYPYLYRNIRSMGMGGAQTAVSGDMESLFYNPAGVTDLGFTLNILNPSVSVGKQALDTYGDVMDAMDLNTDTARYSELSDIIRENAGKALHVRAGAFPSVGVGSFAVGYLGTAEADMRLHEMLSSPGLVEAEIDMFRGLVAGGSYGVTDNLRLGIGGKIISRTWIHENFTVREMAKSEFDISDYEQEGSDMSFDLGMNYKLETLSFLKPTVGLSMMDITGLEYDGDEYLPMRANLGISINPEVPYLAGLVLAMDYQDITHAIEQDGSTWKRINMGAEANVLDHMFVRVGVHQGYPTFGAELKLWVLGLGYAYYVEEMGAYAGQDKDERHMARVSIGWM